MIWSLSQHKHLLLTHSFTPIPATPHLTLSPVSFFNHSQPRTIFSASSLHFVTFFPSLLIKCFLKFQHLMLRCIVRRTYHFKLPLYHVPHLRLYLFLYLYWRMRIIPSTTLQHAIQFIHMHMHYMPVLSHLYYTTLYNAPLHNTAWHYTVVSCPFLSFLEFPTFAEVCKVEQHYVSVVRRG